MRPAVIKRDLKVNKGVYLMAIPVLLYFIIFNYIPMGGVIIAFQNYIPRTGFFKSEWVGFGNFISFFKSYYSLRLIRNTFLLSFYDLIFGFPAPIIFALLLNEVKNRYFKKTVQTVTYMPFFISIVVIAGIIIDFTSEKGFISSVISMLGGQKSNLLGRQEFFRPIYIISNIWQNIGFQSIIYIAALSSIDPSLYEAAVIDGAGRWRQTLHITLPGISSTIIVLLVLRIGSMMSVGFEKIILLYSPLTYETADVISSFVYRKGLLEMNYSYSTAIGLFNSVINFSLLILANMLSKKFSESNLF